MNPQIRFLLVLTLLAALQAGLVWSSPLLQNLTNDELRVLALKLVAERNAARSEDLEIIHSATSNAELTRKTTHSFTILDKRQNKRYEISLDNTGQELNKEGILQNEQAAYQAKYGKLTPALAKRLETTKPDELVPINIVIKNPDDDSKAPQRPPLDTEAYERLSEEEKLAFKEREAAFQKAMDAYLAERAQRILTPIAEKLSKLGTSVKPDRFFLHISARLTPAAITEVNSWEEVRMIDLDHVVLPELNVSRSTIGAAIVEGQGIDGAGVKVGVVDPGGRIQSANPYLTGIFQDSSTVCATPTAHTTAVAGIIRSTHGTNRGVAPGVSLWTGGSCSGSFSELRDRSHGAADWGAKVINLSWGSDVNPSGIPSPGSMDLFYDEFVRFRNVTVVKSAGNEGSDCGRNGNITSPGLAYNVITVGAFKDLNTTGWADDTMFDCSSWRGPASTNGDREKPEIVAPGFKIFTTSLVSTWFANQDGTSMAAPHVTATAALMIQRDPNLADKPNLIKAILLASAAHNIEDGPVFGYRDGAGAISASWAYDITRRWMGGWGFIPYSCTFPNPYLGATLVNIQANLSHAQ